MMATALETGKFEGTLARRRKNGTIFSARATLTPRRDITGDAIGFLLISRDVSDEIRLAQALEVTQVYTRSLIESNVDAIMTTDPLGVITDVNEQMVALTGRPRQELIGSAFKTYFTEPDRADQAIRLVLTEGKVTNYELTARSKEGRETVVSYNASAFFDRDNRLQGVFASARDMTELKAIERALQQITLDERIAMAHEVLGDLAVRQAIGDQDRNLSLALAQESNVDRRFGLSLTKGVVNRLIHVHGPPLSPCLITLRRPELGSRAALRLLRPHFYPGLGPYRPFAG